MAARNRVRTRKARDTRSAVERMIDERREQSRQAWARRHPELARAERSLRRARVQRDSRWSHKNDGTAETHEHASRQEGRLAELYRTGTIDAEQLLAAVEIANVAERIGRDVAVKTASLETRVDMTRMGDGSFFERLGQVRREYAYTRWREKLPHPAPVLDMLVGDPEGFTVVARRYRMHHRKAKRLLIEALDRWPAELIHACRMIDDDALDKAHVRLGVREIIIPE
jgi:hypothetical protein